MRLIIVGMHQQVAANLNGPGRVYKMKFERKIFEVNFIEFSKEN